MHSRQRAKTPLQGGDNPECSVCGTLWLIRPVLQRWSLRGRVEGRLQGCVQRRLQRRCARIAPWTWRGDTAEQLSAE